MEKERNTNRSRGSIADAETIEKDEDLID